jgi:hypothetical protein
MINDKQRPPSALNQIHAMGLKIGLLFAVFLSLSACQSANSGSVEKENPEILLTFQRGDSPEGVKSRLGRGLHEFTSINRRETNVCVSYHFQKYGLSYFLLFHNSKLAKILLPPRFSHEMNEAERDYTSTWDSYDPIDRMRTVIESRDLNEENVKASIRNRYRSKGMDNALPGWIIAQTIAAPFTISKRLRKADEIAELAAKYDPFRISLGMTAIDVEQRLGNPNLVEERRKTLLRF